MREYKRSKKNYKECIYKKIMKDVHVNIKDVLLLVTSVFRYIV